MNTKVMRMLPTNGTTSIYAIRGRAGALAGLLTHLNGTASYKRLMSHVFYRAHRRGRPNKANIRKLEIDLNVFAEYYNALLPFLKH